MLRLPLVGTVIPTTRAFLVTLPAIIKTTNAAPMNSAPTVIQRAETGRAKRMLPRSPLFLPEDISVRNNGVAGRVSFDSALKNASVITYLSGSTRR